MLAMDEMVNSHDNELFISNNGAAIAKFYAVTEYMLIEGSFMAVHFTSWPLLGGT